MRVLQLLAAIISGFSVLTPAAGAAAGEQKAQIVIWGGAKTEAGAKPFLDDWAKFKEFFLAAGVSLQDGYPRIIESAKQKGLNPGFFVVALGICPSDQSAKIVAALKTLNAGVYAREVSVEAEKLACPDTSSLASLAVARKAEKAGTNSITVFKVAAPREKETSPGSGEYENAGELTLYAFVLTDKDSHVLAVQHAPGEEDFRGDTIAAEPPFRCDRVSLKRKGEELTLTRECEASGAECGGLLGATEVASISIGASSLSIRTARKNEKHAEPCGD